VTVAQYCRWWRDHVRRREGQAAPDPQPGDTAHARAESDQGPAAKASASAGADSSSGARADGRQDAAEPGSSSLDGGEEPGSLAPLWYLKDWHFTTDFPGYQAASHAMRPLPGIACCARHTSYGRLFHARVYGAMHSAEPGVSLVS